MDSLFPLDSELGEARFLSVSKQIIFPLTPLIGREAELNQLRQLLAYSKVRLLTITGSGGVGKTRLALQLAVTLLEEFEHIHIVNLAALQASELVLPTISQTLNIPATSELPLLARLQEFLRSQKVLLVLDNLEQVLAVGPMLIELLNGCPGLKILVTSRELLRLTGEQNFVLAPLALPDLQKLAPLAELSNQPAIALFVQRAQAQNPAFRLNAINATAIARICVQLDGLPLALELAASWINLLPPAALLVRLAQPLQMLVGGRVDGPSRHQTIRETLEWSYNLLKPAEQTLFRHLMVFVGGCSIEAVEKVCDGLNPNFNILLGLKLLTDKSLIRVQIIKEASSRLLLLETVREYGLEKLIEAGEQEMLRSRHADFFFEQSLEAIKGLRGSEQKLWLDWFELEQYNLRAALTWATDHSLEVALRLAPILAQFWDVRSELSEGRHWLQKVLERSQTTPTAYRAVALNAAANLAFKQTDYVQALALFEAALEIFKQLGDQRYTAIVLGGLAMITFHQGDIAGAIQLYEQSLAVKRGLGEPRSIALTLNNLGEAVQQTGDYARASLIYQEALQLQREVGDQREAAILLLNLGELASYQGQQSQARAYLLESLELFRRLKDKLNLVECLERLAMVAALEQQAEFAARILGAAQNLRQQLGAPQSPTYYQNYERTVKAGQLQIGVTAWDQAWQAGTELSLEQIINEVLAPPSPLVAPAALSSALPPPSKTTVSTALAQQKLTESLSERELEVLRLIAQGFSNQQVADKLVVTLNTVKWHLKNAYAKLEVTNRTQAIIQAQNLKLL